MKDLATSPRGGEIDDDGFSTSSCSSGRGFDFLRWKAGYGWVDRDGVTAPSPLLAVKVDEILRMWKDDRPTDITEKPLPDPDTLNAQIPVSEWEEGLDGRPRPPWAHYVVVYLVDPETATKYVYAAATVGGHIAVEQLKENVITMRMLRGARVMPLVELSSKPMKTKFKMSERPDFRIVTWLRPGDDGGMLAGPSAPQLAGPAAVEVPTATEAKADPISSGPQPKPAINTTLDEMGGAKPVTSREILDDDIPF